MGLEAELKFRVPPGVLKQVEARRLSGRKLGSRAESDLVSTYFDTPKHKLKRHGLTLRVRRSAKRYVQTLKSATDEGYFRGEWEVPIKGSTPDLAKVKGSPLENLSAKKLKRTLKPVFQTSVHRITLPIQRKDVQIELAIDRGTIAAGRHSVPIEELEIELKRGKPQDLFEAANALARTTEAELYLRSKAERGFDLAVGLIEPAIFATPIKLDLHMHASDAFRAIARSAIRHFAGNADAVRNHDPEGIHEMRIGLRRLRAAISLFSTLVRASSSKSIKCELKWLTNQLAPAREFHVFLDETIRPAARDVTPRRGIRAVEQEFKARRAEAVEQATKAVNSRRFRMLLLSVLGWVENERHRTPGDAPIRKFAARLLHRRVQRIRKKGKHLEELSPRARHKLRIMIKKVRYAVEFFESLFRSRDQHERLAQLEKRSKKLQDALGKLNDYLEHRELALDSALNAPRQNRRARIRDGRPRGSRGSGGQTAFASRQEKGSKAQGVVEHPAIDRQPLQGGAL